MIPQMPQGPTQQAPGQAPMTGQMGNALPNMLAQQKGSAPPPQVGQLARMPVEQLKQLFFQTMSMDTGLQPLTVLAAIKQASESQKLQQAIQGQQFRDQAAQQPGTVRDDILQSSYAGGGIVALNKGGEVQRFQSGTGPGGLTTGFAPQYQAMREAGIDISPYDSPEVRADKIRRFEEYKRTGVVPPASQTERTLPTGAEEDRRKIAEFASGVKQNVLLPAGAAIADVATAIPRGLAGAYNSTVVRGLRALGLPIEYIQDVAGGDFSSLTPYYDKFVRQAGQQQKDSAGRAETEDYSNESRVGLASKPAPSPASAPISSAPSGTAAAPRGIGSLAAPAMESVNEERRAARELLERRIRQAEASKNVPPEVRAAQEGVTSLLTESAKATGEERARMKDLAERRMQEARERAQKPGYMDPEVLGEILAGMQGSKNLSAALTGGGAGAGKAVAKRNAAIRAAEDKYDLQQGELFKLDNARRDIEMKKAERAQAIAVGDWDRATKAEQEIIAAQDVYNKASMDVKFKLGEFGLKSRELDLKSQELLQKAQQTRLMAEQIGDTRLANAISLAQARVQQSRDGIKKVVEGALGPMAAMYQMDPSKFSKDQPELYKRVQDAVKDYQNNVMKPADDSLSRLIAQSESRSAGGQKVVTWGDIPGG